MCYESLYEVMLFTVFPVTCVINYCMIYCSNDVTVNTANNSMSLPISSKLVDESITVHCFFVLNKFLFKPTVIFH